MNITQTVRSYTLRSEFPAIARRERRTFAFPLPSTLQLVAVAITALMLLPIGYLVIRAMGAGEDGLAYLLQARTLNVITNSLLLAGAVVAGAVVIGVPFAWLTTRTNLPFRRFWLVSGLLTMVIPSYLGAITYIAAFGPRGLAQQMLAPLSVDSLPPIYGFFGAWLAITLFTYPYIVLPVRAALLNMDPALEEAARSMGLNRWHVFWRVTLPQLRPALAAGALLTALYALSDFGAVAMMRYDAFTRVIYRQYTSSFDRERAAILALVLVVLTVFLLMMERRAAAVTRNYRIGTGCQRQARRVELGRWRLPALAFCGVLVAIGTLTPVGVLLLWLTQTTGEAVFEINAVVTGTVGVSAITALVVGAAALPMAVLAVRSSSKFNHLLVKLAYLGNVLPGVVVALTLVFFAARHLPGLYQTLPVLILGYATRFLPLSIGATRSSLTQINPRYEEAARGLGCRAWQAALHVTLPLAKAGVLGGMALVFLNVMKELPTTLLLAPTGFKTLPTQIWTAYNEVNFAQISAPGLLLMAVSALSLFLLLGRERQA